MSQTHNFLADNITFLASQRGLSLITLAEKIGMDPSTLYRLTDNENVRQPRAKTLRVIADFFQVEPLDLLAKDFREPPLVSNRSEKLASLFGPVATSQVQAPPTGVDSVLPPLININNADAFDPQFIDNHNPLFGSNGCDILQRVPTPHGLSSDKVFALLMVGDAMTPDICDGDLVFVETLPTACKDKDLPETLCGRYVLAKIKVDNRTVITVRKALKNDFGEIVLSYTNTKMPIASSIAIDILGTVSAVQRVFR